jgi:hypothetical protein
MSTIKIQSMSIRDTVTPGALAVAEIAAEWADNLGVSGMSPELMICDFDLVDVAGNLATINAVLVTGRNSARMRETEYADRTGAWLGSLPEELGYAGILQGLSDNATADGELEERVTALEEGGGGGGAAAPRIVSRDLTFTEEDLSAVSVLAIRTTAQHSGFCGPASVAALNAAPENSCSYVATTAGTLEGGMMGPPVDVLAGAFVSFDSMMGWTKIAEGVGGFCAAGVRLRVSMGGSLFSPLIESDRGLWAAYDGDSNEPVIGGDDDITINLPAAADLTVGVAFEAIAIGANGATLTAGNEMWQSGRDGARISAVHLNTDNARSKIIGAIGGAVGWFCDRDFPSNGPGAVGEPVYGIPHVTAYGLGAPKSINNTIAETSLQNTTEGQFIGAAYLAPYAINRVGAGARGEAHLRLEAASGMDAITFRLRAGNTELASIEVAPAAAVVTGAIVRFKLQCNETGFEGTARAALEAEWCGNAMALTTISKKIVCNDQAAVLDLTSAQNIRLTAQWNGTAEDNTCEVCLYEHSIF